MAAGAATALVAAVLVGGLEAADCVVLETTEVLMVALAWMIAVDCVLEVAGAARALRALGAAAGATRVSSVRAL